MVPEADVTLSALKFLTYESEHICRLCFASTEEHEVALEEDIKLQRSFVDETLSFLDMFVNLGVSLEPSLPQSICMNCATLTVNSYLFFKLTHISVENWNRVFEKLDASLHQSESIESKVRTAYFMIKENDNQIIMSSKQQTVRSKKTALSKVREVIKMRHTLHREKRRETYVICEECGERFSNNTQLVKHMKDHNNSRYLCTQCLKLFATKLQLEEHLERLHYPKKIVCPKCAKMFSTEKMLRLHDKLHHVAAVCKLCSIEFPSKKELRAHLDKHDVNSCPRCNKTFQNKYTFKFHLKICGNMEERQPSFFCDICHKGYARKNGIRTHLKIDHGFGNVLSCSWCDKKFDARSKLNNHIVKHTKEKNFHCVHCGGKFVSQAALVYHTRLHTGEKPFPCDMCSESFLSASRRMEHKKRKHIGPTKECHICHVKFVSGYQLRNHVKRHSNPQSKLFVPVLELPFADYQISLSIQ